MSTRAARGFVGRGIDQRQHTFEWQTIGMPRTGRHHNRHRLQFHVHELLWLYLFTLLSFMIRLPAAAIPHPSLDFVHRQHPAAQEPFLHFGLGGLAGRIDIGEYEFEVVPAQALADGVSREMLGEQASRWHNRRAEGRIVEFTGGRAIHVALEAEQHRREVEGIGHHAQQELLPLQP